MYDIFQLLHLDTKEDIFTFCLKEFLNESEDFRRKSAKWWGFKENSGDYECFRNAIEIEESQHGKRSIIIPDLILYNAEHIAVIESKMFSSEGYMQTIDYKDSEDKIIKKVLGGERNNKVDVKFYYFTLAGVQAKSKDFISVSWADYYADTLNQVVFSNNELNVVALAILKRAQDYKKHISELDMLSYIELVKSDNSWITPFSLFSSGALDSKWKMDSKEYELYYGRVNGQGHSDFRTDIYKRRIEDEKIKYEYLKHGKYNEDNIFYFTRIIWGSNSIKIALNMEYWLIEGGKWIKYVPNKDLPSEMKEVAKANRENYISYLKEKIKNENDLRIPAQKENMLEMLCVNIETEGKNISEIVEAVSKYVSMFTNFEKEAIENTHLRGEYLVVSFQE